MHQARVDQLHRIAQRVAHDEADADRDLAALLDEVGDDADPRAVLLYVFGAALARRLSPATERRAGLYLERFEVPQIHLFQLLVTSLPLVGLATSLSNAVLEAACLGEEAPTVLDVGVGSGRQLVTLIEALAAARATGRAAPRALTILAVEPAGAALAQAAKSVAEASAVAGLPVTFHAFEGAAESLTASDWRRMRALCASPPVINASFALHHVADLDGRDVRDDVLRRLRWLGPRLLVLSEPNLHSHERDFYTRFRLCFSHFEVVFAAIDALPVQDRDKNALKVCFFGREIVDMLGRPEGRRTERHESTSSWLRRLDASGWEARFDASVPARSDSGVEVRARGTHASIEFGGEPIISVLCATPRDGEALREADEAALARAPDRREANDEAPRGSGDDAFDAEAYLATLRAVAMADEVLHERERGFIEEQAHLLGVPLDLAAEAPVALEPALRHSARLSRRTRVAIVRDLIFLARVDGHYSDDERDLIAAIAARLGLADELDGLERQADLPAETRGMPSWFREVWFLGSK
ncbi:MAG TPA: hypothetical protein PLR99_25250 [Polyangiaceae bacterium]|nr:hypothetical protein [Polyangiaceae bacterium]